MKRCFVLCFVALLIASQVPSCSKENTKDLLTESNSTMINTSDTDSQTESIETEEETDYLDTLPKKSYPGTSFTIIGKDDVVYAHNFPDATGETGEIISDALFQRNQAVAERFGVKFAYERTSSGGDTVSKVQADVLANGKSYDMVQGSMLTCANVLLNNDCLYKINNLDAIDLSQPWWNNRCATDLAINGNLYYVTGDIMYEHFREVACILFNKDMMEDYGIDADLYQLVKDRKWTFEKMLEVAAAIPSNSNVYRYGLDDISGYDFYFGAGLRITHYDKEGTPYFENTPTDKMFSIIDNYSNVFADTSVCINNTYNWAMGTLDSVGRANDHFQSGNVLFLSCRTDIIQTMRDNELDFGVLPVPKYDELQEDYISYANPWIGSSVSFPKTMKDPEMSGIITEALAYESMLCLRPAMYDNMLKGRSIRDEESADTLDIIFSTKTFDLCDICEWGNLNYFIRDNMLGVKDTLASDYASTINAAKEALSNTIELFNK